MSATYAQAPTIPVASIQRNPAQPRVTFAEVALQELADSIRSVGVLSPIVVRPIPSAKGAPGHFQIIAGERRWRAAQMVGLERVPAIVREDLDDVAAFELSMIENILRADMTPVEEARGYQRLLDFGLTVDQIATRLGKSVTAVHYRLALLRLAAPILDLVHAGQFGERDGWLTSRLSTEGQFRVMRAATAGNLQRPGDLAHLVAAIAFEETQATMFSEDDAPVVSRDTAKATRTVADRLAVALRALEDAAAAIDDAAADEQSELVARELKRQAGRIADRLAARRVATSAEQVTLAHA